MTEQDARPTTRERLKDLRHLGHEMGLCNVVLEHPSTYLDVADIQPVHFSEPIFRLIWGKIQSANDGREKGAPAPTIASILHERDPELIGLADDQYGGFPALRRDFIELRCRPEHAKTFREKVLAMAHQRELVAGTAELAAQVADIASNTAPKVGAIQEAIEAKVADMLQRTTAGSDRAGGLLAEQDPDVWIQSERDKVKAEGEVASLETGMVYFDAFEMLQPGRVTCWLVEYKGGKSTIGVNLGVRLGIGARMASRRDVDSYKAQSVGEWIYFHGEDGQNLKPRKVAMLDLEMDKDLDVQPRMLSLISGVPVKLISSRRYLRDEFDTQRVREAYRVLHDFGIQFDHPRQGSYDLRWIRNVVRETVYRNGTEVLILDYLRPPPDMDKNESHIFEAALADTVKQLTNDFGLVTITFAQLNREGIRAKKQRFGFVRPTSSDIQGNIKTNNFVDTMIVQDNLPADERQLRWWVDHSRVTEKSVREFMRVEPVFSQSLMEVTGIESIQDQQTERKQRRSGTPRAAAPAEPPPDPAETITYEGEPIQTYGYAQGDIPF